MHDVLFSLGLLEKVEKKCGFERKWREINWNNPTLLCWKSIDYVSSMQFQNFELIYSL